MVKETDFPKELLQLSPEALDHLPTMVAVFDAAGRFVWTNREWREKLGYTLAEARRGEVLERMYSDPSERTKAREWIERRRSEWGQFSLRTADGEVLETRWINLPVPNGGSIGIGEDVTERRRLEARVRESEMQHRLLYQTMETGVVYQSASGAVTEANPAAERILGLTLAQMQGRTSADPRWRALREDETPLPGSEHPSMVALSTGQRVHAATMGVYNPALEETRWILVDAIPQFRGGEERPHQVYTTFRDITALHRANKRLELQAELLDSVGESVIAVDPASRITYANRFAGALYGFNLREIIGKPLSEVVIAGEHHQQVAEQVEEAMREGRSWSAELELQGRGGGTFVALVTCSPLTGTGGQLTGAVTTATDITAQKELEAQLRQGQKMEAIGRLAGGIAHDFNNLLTAIQGHASILSEDLEPGGSLTDEVMEIQSAANRAALMTRQLLAFSRRQRLEERQIDLGHAIGDMSAMLRRLIPESIDLDVEPPAEPCVVRVDPGQITQVVMNLVLNAVDAIDDQGQIRLRVAPARLTEAEADALAWRAKPGHYAELVVEDTGSGMEPDVVAHMFEPFFTTKGVGEGTGLGLATVFGIVKQSRGHVFVETEPGRGTTFRILLPRTAGGPEGREEHRPKPGEVRGRLILVVEDDPSVRKLVRRVLERSGHTVLEAQNGREGLEVARKYASELDLVLSDVVMPELGGHELEIELRTICPEVRVILASGYTEQEISGELAARGVAFLPKPFTPAELLQAVSEVLD